ncbi:MAG: SIS domain-containing protein [Methylobacter sp.]|uniref:SIS domain-containing protein n=1 Tax=Methylobacter sp. TaxID=2051955 RepID=UPI00272523BE|nr:SIS domain-containing protein [Methylobacter sp.]MDO9268982.1 SIS domain-containing protein [Methylobacter sp.]MDP1667236.1 SIS domain-containing protein [Methylobacter sp.]
MSLQNRIINHFTNSIQTQQDTMSNLGELIEFASQRLVATLLNDKKIVTCGNGRSGAVAQLLSSAMLNQYERDRPSLPAIALTTDTTTLTAIANDYHFDDIFAKQLRALGQSGDILIAYTDGNNSANIAKAITTAHDKDITVIALTGNNGGMIAPLLNEIDIEIRVPSNTSVHIQEVHTLITHCLCDLIDHQLFGG